ncbi:MAG: M16 family metallopeptidase [Geminicoccaceae bacterium]
MLHRTGFLGHSLGLGLALVTALTLPPSKADAAARVEHVVSEGGIEAYLISEPSIPFMSLSMRFAGGAVSDPEGREGVANLVSGLLDEGAGDLDSQAFQTELEDLAIRLSFSAGRDSFAGDLKTLTENRERAFELLRLALNEPRFDDEPVDRIRSQIQASLRRRLDDPDRLASRAWFERAFDEHVYARPVEGTIESVAAITTDDLRSFVKNRLARGNLLIGVAGDITAAELGPLLDHAFGALPAAAQPLEHDQIEPAESGIAVIRQDVPQSKVLFGQKGLKREDPDFYAAYVANHILGGGGFTSRLTKEIREARGLAYSVYSYLYPTEFAPIWLGGLGTSNASVAQALELVHQEVRRMAEGDIGDQELADAKTYLTGSFPLRLTSNDRIAGLLVSMQVNDLGLDYLDKRNGFIEAVTLDDLKRVAARLYHPENLLTVVVGDPPDLEG